MSHVDTHRRSRHVRSHQERGSSVVRPDDRSSLIAYRQDRDMPTRRHRGHAPRPFDEDSLLSTLSSLSSASTDPYSSGSRGRHERHRGEPKSTQVRTLSRGSRDSRATRRPSSRSMFAPLLTRSRSRGSRGSHGRSTGSRTPTRAHAALSKLAGPLRHPNEHNTGDRVVQLLKSSGGPLAVLTVAQHSLWLILQAVTKTQIVFGSSGSKGIDLALLRSSIADFRCWTNMGDFAGVYTSTRSRRAAREGDRVTKLIDWTLIGSTLFAATGEASAWFVNHNVLRLSKDPLINTSRANWLDSWGARFWALALIFSVLKIAREEAAARKEMAPEIARLRRRGIPASVARRKVFKKDVLKYEERQARKRQALVSGLYTFTALGFGFPGGIITPTILSSFAVVSQSINVYNRWKLTKRIPPSA